MTRYVSVTDTAKLIRPALAKQFPEVKFSVRSQSYSGGASINVSWTDGPRAKDVDCIIGGFEGRSFDGMNDLASIQESWIKPDGEAELAYRPDSYGGSKPAFYSDAPHPNAELVHFGANYVFSNRHVSDWDRREIQALEYIRAHCRCEGDPPSDRFGNQWVDGLARQMAQDFGQSETVEQTFDRVVLNHGLD
ncbi:hypothetical protein LCGC14_0827110 [marine sediment metagenome]|uniref:Large polyvalent protein associated domain-containing protein n=1 Tax=marine sediment metagenome TaxID=412755 RepID=A0A0F9Q2B7_9ZZZZ